MASCPGAESSLNDAGLAELVRRIQIGDQAAIEDLRSIFSAGVEFLLRRKLQKHNVAVEAARVLEAAVQEIRNSSPGQPVDLRHVVVNIIHVHVPSVEPDREHLPSDSGSASVARSVLAERTPVEQNILRRYYVLGESADTIRLGLGLSSETVGRVIASARADYRCRVQKTGSG